MRAEILLNSDEWNDGLLATVREQVMASGHWVQNRLILIIISPFSAFIGRSLFA